MGKRDLLSVADLGHDLATVLDLAAYLKNLHRSGEPHEPLKGRNLAMIFEKPSTRTRVSFEVAMTQLGGHALYLSSQDLQLGRGETIGDTAKVLSRYADAVVYRAFRHEHVVDLARHATVPVINGLDDREHPCQAVSDLFTVQEKKGSLAGLRLAYVGDGNNVCHSLLLACALAGMSVVAACPPGYEPNAEIVEAARQLATRKEARVEWVREPGAAVAGADIVYTDVWVSMGMEADRAAREKAFRGYGVDGPLMKAAKPDALFMHCLPAHRGHEVTDEVIDGPQSIVFDQAENRLHAQKAILVHLLGGKR